MKSLIIKIFFIILCLCLFSCKKVEDKNKDFIGFWRSFDNDPDFIVSIDIGSSYGDYSEDRYGGGKVGFHGTARLTSHKIYIGSFYHFNIIDQPHRIDTTSSNIYIYDINYTTQKKANWTMTLSDAKPAFYLKGNMTFYKADY